MDRNAILEVIQTLAHSQGFYTRLWARIKEVEKNNPESYEELMAFWESKHFKDAVDFILFIEG